MAANVWSSAGSTDGNLASNWSLGALSATDTLTFDATSVVDCTFTAAINCAGITATAAYTGHIDFADGSYSHAVSGSVTLDCHAVDLGNGTITVGGDFDLKDVETITYGAGTLVLTGTGNLVGKVTYNCLNKLTIASGAAITVTGSLFVVTTITFDGGSVNIATGQYLGGSIDCSLIMNSGTITASGTGYIYFYMSASGKGLTTFTAGTISAAIQLARTNVGAVFIPGTYGGRVVVCNYGTASGAWTPSAGTYNLNGGLTISNNSNTATVTFNCANATSFNITGDWTVTNSAAGTLTITNSTGNPSFNVTGNIAVTNSGGGTLNYTKGTSTITLSGTSDQTINVAGKAVESLIVTKATSGAITWTSGDTITAGGAWSMAADFTNPTGVSIDLADGGYSHSFVNVTISNAAADIFDMGNSTLTVSGNFDWSGAAGTITEGTSTLVMTGTGKTLNVPWNSSPSRTVRNLTIQAGSTIATPTTSLSYYIDGLFTLNGAFTFNSGASVYFRINDGMTQGANGAINGTGTLFLYGGTITLANTTALTIANIRVWRLISLPPGTYSPATLFYVDSTNAVGDDTFTWQAGAYTFTSQFKISHSGPQTFTVSGVNNPTLIFQNTVFITNSGGGTLLFTNNSVNPNQLTGTASHTVYLSGYNMGTWVINKPAAGAINWTSGDTITAGGAWTSAAAVTLRSGLVLFDANGYAMSITGAFTASCTTLDWGEGLWTFGGSCTYSAVTNNTQSTAAVTFNGTGNDTYTPKTGATVGGAFTVNKASGNFTQAGAISAASFTVTSGTLVPGLLVANVGSLVAVYIGDSIIHDYTPTVSYTYWDKGAHSQTTTQIAARFAADVVALTPRFVLMEGGVNDIAGGVITKATFLANWTSMFDAAHTAGIAMLVLKILPWSNGTNAQLQKRDDWNASLATLAAGYANTYVLDLSSALGQFRVGGDAGNLWDLIPAYTTDGVHPNAAGYVAMAAAIEALVFSSALGTTSYNLTTTSNLTVGTAGQVSPNYLAGVTWTVGGALSLTGELGDLLTLNPASAWTLTVTGAANARWVNADYSNAAGGTEIDALDTGCVDGGHNTNWLFVEEHSVSSASSGSSLSSLSSVSSTSISSLSSSSISTSSTSSSSVSSVSSISSTGRLEFPTAKTVLVVGPSSVSIACDSSPAGKVITLSGPVGALVEVPL